LFILSFPDYLWCWEAWDRVCVGYSWWKSIYYIPKSQRGYFLTMCFFLLMCSEKDNSKDRSQRLFGKILPPQCIFSCMVPWSRAKPES